MAKKCSEPSGRLKRNSLRCAHSRHCAGGGADRRCQSTPITNHCHCSALICQLVSPASGQVNWPRCSRRRHIHTPVPSQHTTFSRVRRRLLKTYAVPSQGAPERLLHMQRQSIDAGAHVDWRYGQPDRIGLQFQRSPDRTAAS